MTMKMISLGHLVGLTVSLRHRMDLARGLVALGHRHHKMDLAHPQVVLAELAKEVVSAHLRVALASQKAHSVSHPVVSESRPLADSGRRRAAVLSAQRQVSVNRRRAHQVVRQEDLESHQVKAPHQAVSVRRREDLANQLHRHLVVAKEQGLDSPRDHRLL